MTQVTKESLSARIAELESGTRSIKEDYQLEAYRMLTDLIINNDERLSFDYLNGHKDGLEWAAQLAEANHPETGDWLYDDPIELAKAIRKGPDMPPALEVDADDNFYSWFGREWEKYYQPNHYSSSAKKHLGAIAESAWYACRASMLAVKHKEIK